MASRHALLGIVVASSVGVGAAQAQPPSVPEARIAQSTNGARLTAPSSASALRFSAPTCARAGTATRRCGRWRSFPRIASSARASRTCAWNSAPADLQVYGVYVKASLTPRGELISVIENLVADSCRQRRAGTGRRGARAGRRASAPVRRRGRAAGTRATRRRHGGVCPHTVLPQGAASHAGRGAARRRPAGRRVPGRDVEPERQSAAPHAGRRRRRRRGVENRTANEPYNVFEIYPGASNGPEAGSPAQWLLPAAQTTVNINGNNVNAYLDTDANNTRG